MRVALLAPFADEQSGIADYAYNFAAALREQGVETVMPFDQARTIGTSEAECFDFVRRTAWHEYDVVHAELGGGRLREFHCLQALHQLQPAVRTTATVHDPERLVWKPGRLPGVLQLVGKVSRLGFQAAALLADPLTLRRERQVAHRIQRLVTLTYTGANRLRERMRLPAEQLAVIPHGNHLIPSKPLPSLSTLRLLYFGFIYRGKGIEDLIDSLALLVQNKPALRNRLCLTLAGGTSPDIAFGASGSYLDELKARIRERNVADLVEFNTDIGADAIPDLIQAHHVMVLPYRESKRLSMLGEMRGTSGALSWAAACGRGAVTSDARAFPEEVAQGNGTVFPQGDVAELAKILGQLADKPERIADWAGAATRVGQRRQWPRVAEQFRQLFLSTSVVEKENA